MIYLDSAATSQKPRRVIDCESRLYCETNANVHRGVHYLSEQATELFEEARERVRRFIGAASREEMYDATMYIVGVDAQTNEVLNDIDSCMMCKRQIINSGISTVVFRVSETEYEVVKVRDWVINDDSLGGTFGY